MPNIAVAVAVEVSAVICVGTHMERYAFSVVHVAVERGIRTRPASEDILETAIFLHDDNHVFDVNAETSRTVFLKQRNGTRLHRWDGYCACAG